MQDNRMSATLNEDGTFSAADEIAYQKLRSSIVLLVNELHLHNNRIEALIDQLYGINRRIMSIDSGMVKLADAARINRREFIDEYRGAELDPTWVDRMAERQGPRLAGAVREIAATRSKSCAATWPGRPACRRRHRGIPPHREPGAEGRERSASGQEGNGRGEPASGDLDRQEIHQPRPAIP
jgi:hypothetical protein